MLSNFTLQRLAVLTIFAGLVGCSPAATNTTSNSGGGATNANSGTTTAAQSGAPAANDTRPLVVATHSVLCDLTKQIAAETVNLKCLIEAGSDPHVYQPTPDDGKAIEQAKLVLYGGYDFEPDLIRLIKASSNPAPKVAVSELAVPKPLMGEHDHDHGEEAKGEAAKEGSADAAAHDHDHAPGAEAELVADPHVWHDAQVGVRMAEVVEENLSKVVPDQAALYATNTDKVTSELSQIDAWIKQQIATIPANSRKLVTTHDALGYFASAYNIPVEGALAGLSTEEKPTPTRVKNLVDNIKTTGVPTVFAELTINPTLIETVAKEANVKVADQELFADGLGAPGSPGDTYQKMLISNTETIVKGLGGQFQPFVAKPAKTSSLPNWLRLDS